VDAIKLLRTALFALCTCSATAIAQQYPTKPVHLVVGVAAGGGLDSGARLIASKMSELLGQPFLVENRPGAGSTISAAMVAKAPPDGYTLLFAATALLISPALYEKLSYDPLKSFTPVGTAGTEILVIAVNPAFPVKTTAELIALVKANPGKYSYASAGVGSIHHLAMEMFKKQAGLDILHVPYKGSAPVVPDLIGGVVPMAMMSMITALPQAKAGKLRPIAITSASRISIAPDWPAIAETLPGFDAVSMRTVLAPAGTPAEVISRLADALRATLAMEDVKQIFASQATSGEFIGLAALAVRMQADLVKWSTAAKESGAKPDN
jgi:tripartite-type tricarboxylate transporter receptor subunit TctC